MEGLQVAITVNESDAPEQKKQAWQEINRLSPDMAEFIKTITAEFGKPQFLTVEAI